MFTVKQDNEGLQIMLIMITRQRKKILKQKLWKNNQVWILIVFLLKEAFSKVPVNASAVQIQASLSTLLDSNNSKILHVHQRKEHKQGELNTNSRNI